MNAKRASLCGNVITKTSDPKIIGQSLSKAVAQHDIAPAAHSQKKSEGDKDAATDEIEIQAYGYLVDESDDIEDPTIQSRRGRIVTLRGTPEELSRVAQNPIMSYIQRSHTIPRPSTRNEGLEVGEQHPAPIPEKWQKVDTRKVLVGIIDTGGFDFAHSDFVKHGKTRFISIWDQGGKDFPAPKRHTGRHDQGRALYGSELTKEHLDTAMEQAAIHGGFDPIDLMPQSQMKRGSHATHVASIAAGNNSFAPDAAIAGVLISLPDEDWDSQKSFYDTTRITDAVDYLVNLSEAKGYEHLSINISLGTNGGPHDNSTPMNRWIDYALTKAGRCISVAAGNAGQEAGTGPSDIGYTLGRIHTSGKFEATGLEKDLEWVVVGNGIEDISENELEIWYAPQDRIAVSVKPPGEPWTKVIEPGEYMQNVVMKKKSVVSIFNRIYDPGNSCNKISVHLTPFYGEDSVIGITPGVWKVRMIGRAIRDGQYHGWIERDDPVLRSSDEDSELWQFPSFFSKKTNVDHSSISTLACGDRVIAVANYDPAEEKINISSSQGPTRDGGQKPDIAAPGTSIWAANGFDREVPWTAKTGTSMASPYIASIAAAMMANADKPLTSSQIIGIIRRTAKPRAGDTYHWQNTIGFGLIDPAKCIRDAKHAGSMIDRDSKG